MSKAKDELKKLLADDATADAVNDAVNDAAVDAAAATLATAAPEGDPPSEAVVDLDFDFLSYDPTDFVPHFKRVGMKQEAIDALFANYVLRWCNTDHRMLDKRVWEGWEIVQGPTGPIKRGDVIAARMPKERAARVRAQLEERNKMREDAPMAKFEMDANSMVQSGQFSTFDDPSGPRLRR